MDLFFYICLLTLSAIVSSTIILFFLHRNPKAPHSPTTILKPYPILGNLPHFFNNHHRLLDWVTELLTTSPTGTVTVAPFIFTADPAVVEHITVTRFANYQKGHTIVNLQDLLGQGIFNADGDTWHLQRKTASFEFNTNGLRTFLHDAIHRELDTRLLPILASSARTGSVIELHDLLKRFAFDNICSLGFGIDLAVLGGAAAEDSEQFYNAFENAVNLSIYRWSYHFHLSWKLRRWLNIGLEHKLRASLATVRGSIKSLMQRTRASARLDLVSRFAASGALTNEAICDNMISFLIAGRDTMPSSLTWFFWEISSKPHVRERILDEIKSTRSNSGEEGGLNLEQLKRMQYLHAALTESMRLHPPVPLQDRECMEDDVLPDGTVVRKGWTVKFSSYVMGRSERLWGKGWAEFRPERWMEEGIFKPGSPFKYPVFNAGPRVCLGREMAYIQMKAVAAAVLERFDMEVAEERGEKQVLMTMGMRGGLPVRMKERKPLEQVFSE